MCWLIGPLECRMGRFSDCTCGDRDHSVGHQHDRAVVADLDGLREPFSTTRTLLESRISEMALADLGLAVRVQLRDALTRRHPRDHDVLRRRVPVMIAPFAS